MGFKSPEKKRSFPQAKKDTKNINAIIDTTKHLKIERVHHYLPLTCFIKNQLNLVHIFGRHQIRKEINDFIF